MRKRVTSHFVVNYAAFRTDFTGAVVKKPATSHRRILNRELTSDRTDGRRSSSGSDDQQRGRKINKPSTKITNIVLSSTLVVHCPRNAFRHFLLQFSSLTRALVLRTDELNRTRLFPLRPRQTHPQNIEFEALFGHRNNSSTNLRLMVSCSSVHF